MMTLSSLFCRCRFQITRIGAKFMYTAGVFVCGCGAILFGYVHVYAYVCACAYRMLNYPCLVIALFNSRIKIDSEHPPDISVLRGQLLKKIELV